MRRFLNRTSTSTKTTESRAGARMILVEREVPAVASVLASTEGGSEVIVHMQQDQDFLSLVHAALGSLRELGRTARALRRVVLVVGDDACAPTLSARQLLTRALVTHMAASGGGELELVGPTGGHLAAREDLLFLVEELLPISCCGSVAIRVRFAEKARIDDPVRRAA